MDMETEVEVWEFNVQVLRRAQPCWGEVLSEVRPNWGKQMGTGGVRRERSER